jgi:hypothetical protein
MNAKEQADKMRAEAKSILNTLLGIPNGYSSDTIDRLVDCIIGAAILEITSITTDAVRR